MAKAKMGAVIRYGGHEGTFVADIFEISGVNVVKASREVTMENLNRDKVDYANATHQLNDFPEAGCWDPARGYFIVPKKQVTVVKD